MNKEKQIKLNLNDILGYVRSTLLYLETKNEKLDKEEIIMYLKSVPEIREETPKEEIKEDNEMKENDNKEFDPKELDENVEVTIAGIKTILTNSVAFIMMIRSNTNPFMYFDQSDFKDIIDFNTFETISILGVATRKLHHYVSKNVC